MITFSLKFIINYMYNNVILDETLIFPEDIKHWPKYVQLSQQFVLYILWIKVLYILYPLSYGSSKVTPS